jgi:Asp-tRNA(Asn)/Glu-tRNA(Gln) amidotransferase A subunit family amidase
VLGMAPDVPPGPHYVQQHSDGFVPPPPVQAEKNRLVVDLEKRQAEAERELAKPQHVVRVGLVIATRLALMDGSYPFDVHPDDRDAAAAEARAIIDRLEWTDTDETERRLGTLIHVVAAKYRVARELRRLEERCAAELAKIFRQADVTSSWRTPAIPPRSRRMTLRESKRTSRRT